MSEPTTEPTEPEPDTDAEPEPEQIEGGDEDQEQEPEAVKLAGPSTEARMKAADKANRDYVKRLDKILGPDETRHECVYCNGLGVAWGEQGEAPTLVHPDNLVTCEACNGYGLVSTGSKNPDHITAICTACSAMGYITRSAQPSNVAPIAPYVPPTDAPIGGQWVPGRGFVPFGSVDPIPGSLTG